MILTITMLNQKSSAQFTILKDSRVNVRFPNPWTVTLCWDPLITTGKIRCTAIGYEYQSFCQISLLISLNSLDTRSPQSQKKKFITNDQKIKIIGRIISNGSIELRDYNVHLKTKKNPMWEILFIEHMKWANHLHINHK